MTLGPTRQTLARRMLDTYRATGALPGLSGGDHDADDSDGTDGETDRQPDDATPGDAPDDGAGSDTGFKAITSQDDLDRIIRERLGRARKQIAKDVRQEITDEARRKEAEEQGDYRKLYDELKSEHETATGAIEALTGERDALKGYFDGQYTAALKDLPEAIRDFAPEDDASYAAKAAWLTKAQQTAKKLEADSPRGNPPGRKPTKPKIETPALINPRTAF